MNALLEHRDLWLIGGGGKTTLMFRLAAAWAGRGEPVICTTTTKIAPPAAAECPDLRLGELGPLVAGLRERPSVFVTLVRRLDAGKCHGFPADGALSLRDETRHLVVEADGAAGRPVKAHAAHEPVIATGATCVVAVVGGWCVGAPLDAQHVHRPERFAALSGRPLGATLSASDVAAVILHDEGWFSSAPPAAALHVVVTGDGTALRKALEDHPRAGRLAGLHAW